MYYICADDMYNMYRTVSNALDFDCIADSGLYTFRTLKVLHPKSFKISVVLRVHGPP